MKQALKKIVNFIIDAVIVLILVVSLIVVVLSLTTKSSGVPNIFGVAPLSVQTDSMEDTLMVGDLIFSEVTNDPGYEYKVGDIVTFPIEKDGISVLNTHRIVEVIEDEVMTYYRTQGDNQPEPDETLQRASTIVAKFNDDGFKIPGVGSFLSFIRTQLGFFLCVLLPMIIFFIYEAIRVIMNLIAYSKEKAVEEAKKAIDGSELTEEQKQKAIEEYLKSIGKEQGGSLENEPAVQTPADGNNSLADK